MLFIYAFATGDVMSVVKYENDKDDLKGTDLVLSWSFLYQKNGEKRYLHALDFKK